MIKNIAPFRTFFGQNLFSKLIRIDHFIILTLQAETFIKIDAYKDLSMFSNLTMTPFRCYGPRVVMDTYNYYVHVHVTL